MLACTHSHSHAHIEAHRFVLLEAVGGCKWGETGARLPCAAVAVTAVAWVSQGCMGAGIASLQPSSSCARAGGSRSMRMGLGVWAHMSASVAERLHARACLLQGTPAKANMFSVIGSVKVV